MSYCAGAAATWVAFRDADGAWTRELPAVTGATTTFRHSFTNNRGAIASFRPVLGGEFSVLSVLYGLPSELSSEGDTTEIDCVTGDFKTLRGDVSGLDTTQAALIAVGRTARTGVVPQFGLEFSIDGVATGRQDLLASRVAFAAPPRLILRRDLDLPNGSRIATLDFASAEAFDMVPATLTIENAGANAGIVFSVLTTAHGEFFLPIAPVTEGPSRQYFAVPADRVLAGDMERLEVSSNGATTRTAEVYFRSPVNRTVTLGSDIAAPSVSVIAGSAAPRLRARYGPHAEYDKLSSIVYLQPTTRVFIIVAMTPAYAALTGGYDIDFPDLAGVPGFDPSWALTSGVVTWTAFRVGGTLPLGRDASAFDGATRRTSTLQGTMTLP